MQFIPITWISAVSVAPPDTCSWVARLQFRRMLPPVLRLYLDRGPTPGFINPAHDKVLCQFIPYWLHTLVDFLVLAPLRIIL